MRNLILLRGAMGAGKSEFVKQNGIGAYTLCADEIRTMIESPVATIEGELQITQKNDKEVWSLLMRMLEKRMERGETTIIDATHSRSKLINRYRELCKKYRYRCIVVDFDAPLETLLKQNKSRARFKWVPEEAVEMAFHRLQTDKIPSWCNVIKPEEFAEFTQIKVDFNHYRKVVFIGDIHGCMDPLLEYFGEEGPQDDTMYVFLGDYTDRGIQNKEVVEWFLKNKSRNIMMLTGNHDQHMLDLVKGRAVQSSQAKQTFEELKESLGLPELKKYVNFFAQMAYFDFGEHVFVATHGGIPCEPSLSMSTEQMIGGVGKYAESDFVDATFASMTPDNHVSVHGHRNVNDTPMRANHKAFNLCDRVEYGEYLRVLEYDKKEFKEILIKNNTFDPDLKTPSQFKRPEAKVNLAAPGVLGEMNRDPKVIKKNVQGSVYSYGFHNSVFKKKTWTPTTMKARGLFVDDESGKVVARSLDKFFNWHEMNFTKSQALKESLKFPVVAYHKYNGFLGILSVYEGEWFISSKNTTQSDHAGFFKTILEEKEVLTEELKSELVEKNLSLVFEVIDPVNDPHIVSYDDSGVVLLEAIVNQFELKRFNFEELNTLGVKHGVEVKKADHVFDTWEELYAFRKEQDDRNGFEPNCEGWVLEDAAGFMWKYKTPYYAFWKKIRSLVGRIAKKGGDHTDLRNDLRSRDEFVVYNELIKLPIEFLEENKNNILLVREKVGFK